MGAFKQFETHYLTIPLRRAGLHIVKSVILWGTNLYDFGRRLTSKKIPVTGQENVFDVSLDLLSVAGIWVVEL